MPQDLPSIIALIVILLLSLSWHEAAHAWVADRLGDPTARSLGRVTLNPIRHMDPFLTVLLPAVLILSGSPFVFGGGKPVPINPAHFRHKARDFMFVALAGPGSNLLLAAAFGLAFVICVAAGVFEPTVLQASGYPDRVVAPSILHPGSLPQAWLGLGLFLNLVLALFNLMPIPPLDGSRVVGWLLPRPMQAQWYRLDRSGLLLVLVFFFVLDGFQYVWMALNPLYGLYTRGADQLAALVAP